MVRGFRKTKSETSKHSNPPSPLEGPDPGAECQFEVEACVSPTGTSTALPPPLQKSLPLSFLDDENGNPEELIKKEGVVQAYSPVSLHPKGPMICAKPIVLTRLEKIPDKTKRPTHLNSESLNLLQSSSSSRVARGRGDKISEVSESDKTSSAELSEVSESLGSLNSEDDYEKICRQASGAGPKATTPILSKAETKAEKKKKEKEEAAKILKRHKKRIYRLVQCCIVPIGAIALLRRVLESLM